jgi:hypothetical protein
MCHHSISTDFFSEKKTIKNENNNYLFKIGLLFGLIAFRSTSSFPCVGFGLAHPSLIPILPLTTTSPVDTNLEVGKIFNYRLPTVSTEFRWSFSFWHKKSIPKLIQFG